MSLSDLETMLELNLILVSSTITITSILIIVLCWVFWWRKKRVRCLIIYEDGSVEKEKCKMDGNQAQITKEWRPIFHKNRQLYIKEIWGLKTRRYNVFNYGEAEDIDFSKIKIFDKVEKLNYLTMLRLCKAEILKWLGKRKVEPPNYIGWITLTISLTSLVLTLLVCWKLGVFQSVTK